jgi:TetR/AcrR family transcriptional regulator, lmrAB and yxaGH operons repressor
MGRSSNARARLIEIAGQLFQRQGYHASGLNQILGESGAPKGSFYYHFPDGKEQLAEASVRAAGEAVERIIEKAFGRARSFGSGAERFGALLADWFEESGFAAGCPVTSVLLETTPQSAPLLAACRAVFDAWIGHVEVHASRLDEGARARELALGLIMAMEGAWLLARAQRSTAPFRLAARLRPA